VFPAVGYEMRNDAAIIIRHECQKCRMAIGYLVSRDVRQQRAAA
jgi:hypothetical protein